MHTEELITTKYLKDRLVVFDDSMEIAHSLIKIYAPSSIDHYTVQEAAVHIDGLYALAKEMMKHIKKLEEQK